MPRTRDRRREHPDAALAELAARQHGVVARRQLTAAGMSDDAICHRIAVGYLRRVHAGVYLVGHRLLEHGHYRAAVLACGEKAVLSHRAAAALWALRPAPSGPIDVTIPRGCNRRRPGVAVHRTRSLRPAHVTVCEAIPCTTPARTLVDLAAVVHERHLRQALEQSLVLRLFDRTALDDALAAAGRRRGTGTLRRLLQGLADDPAPARSELERRFLELTRRAGLPHPVMNAMVAGHEVDFHWPAQRLVVETDGRATHDTPYGFERDRRRDLDLELAGWHVLRTTWRQISREPGRVVALLRTRLASRAHACTSSEIAPT